MIGQVIEKSQACLIPEAPRTYHAFTKDLITNEIFRRVEPKGRTMAEYWEEELKEKLGADVHLRVSDADLTRVYDFENLGFFKIKKNTDLPKDHPDRLIHMSMSESMGMMDGFKANKKRVKAHPNCPKTYDVEGANFKEQSSVSFSFVHKKEVKQGEIVAAFCHATAKGMAKVAACMANGGECGEMKLLSKEAWEKCQAEPKMGVDKMVGQTQWIT